MSTLEHGIESCFKCLIILIEQVQDRSEEFLQNKNNDNKKISWKATGHNDHCMINMGSQRPNIGGNWPLIGPYLQCRQTILCNG